MNNNESLRIVEAEEPNNIAGENLDVILALGELPEWAIASEHGLATMFHRHPCSVKRAVDRGELPPPTRLFGKPVWTIKSIREHLQFRLAEAARESSELTDMLQKRGLTGP